MIMISVSDSPTLAPGHVGIHGLSSERDAGETIRWLDEQEQEENRGENNTGL